MTWRELGVYVRCLPRSSRLGAAVLGDEASEWTRTDYLLADVFDVLANANWQRSGDKNRSRPKPYPRPVSKQVREALGRRLRNLKGGTR